MKKQILLSVAIATICSLTSCYNTRVLVGNVAATDPVVEVQSAWNHHLLYIVPIANTKLEASKYVGDAENYVVKTNLSFINLLVSGITFGIYTPSQTKFYIPTSDLRK